MAFSAALTMDVSGFTNGINKAASGVASLNSTIQGLAALKIVGEAISIVAEAVGTQFLKMYSAMEAGGALVDLSEQTGLAIDKLMVLQTAFKQAGLGAEEVQPVINKMQKAIESAATTGGPAASAFSKLGLSAQKLSGMGADQQLQLIGDAISKIQNPTERAATAMEVFGKSGGRVLALFASGGLDEAAQAVGKQAQLMRDNAGIFDRVTDILGTAATKLQGLYVGVASKVAPMLMTAVNAFKNIDLSGLGEQIGRIVSIVLEAFSEGVLGKLAFEALKYAFENSVNMLSGGLSAVFSGSLQALISGFTILTKGDFWRGMLTTLVGIAQSFISKMANGIAYILDQWAKLPGIGEKAAKAAESLRTYGQEVGTRGAENTGAGTNALAPIFKDASKEIATATKAAFSEAPRMEQTSKLNELLTKLGANAAIRQEAMRQLYPTKAPEVPGAELQAISKPGNEFASSLAKIGGSMFGPSMNGDESLNVQRMQLEQQRRHTDQINESNLLLKMISNKMANATSPTYN